MPSKPYESRLKGPWGRILESTYCIKVDETYRRLQAELTEPGNDDLAYVKVLHAVNKSSANYFEAVALHNSACLYLISKEDEIDSALAKIRSKARASLLAIVSKQQATKQAIEEQAMVEFPEEYNRLIGQRKEMVVLKNRTEKLVEAWSKRCTTLKTTLEQIAKRK